MTRFDCHRRVKQRFLPAAAGLAAGLLSFLSPVNAQDGSLTVHAAGPSGASVPVSNGRIALTQATIDCSVYGAGYVVVQGTTRCVRIGGRIRLKNPDNGYSGANFLPYAGASRTALPMRFQSAPAAARWHR